MDTAAIGFEDIRNGFEGCMKDIKIQGTTLPYSGSSEVGTLQKFEKVEFHCKRSYVPGAQLFCNKTESFSKGLFIQDAGHLSTLKCEQWNTSL